MYFKPSSLQSNLVHARNRPSSSSNTPLRYCENSSLLRTFEVVSSHWEYQHIFSWFFILVKTTTVKSKMVSRPSLNPKVEAKSRSIQVK